VTQHEEEEKHHLFFPGSYSFGFAALLSMTKQFTSSKPKYFTSE